MRTHMILIALLLAACSSGGYVPPTSTPAKFTGEALPQGPRDFGEAHTDLGQRSDLSAPPDLGSLPDLATSPPDMASPADLAEHPDLASSPDMGSPTPGCYVTLKPSAVLPVSLGPGTYTYELGEVPRPELGVDMTVQFVRNDRLFTKYRVSISDDSCSTKCPPWVHESYGAGKYTYRAHDTAGWRRAVLTVEVYGVGTTVELQVVQLLATCK